jgi:hypothetical protein
MTGVQDDARIYIILVFNILFSVLTLIIVNFVSRVAYSV